MFVSILVADDVLRGEARVAGELLHDVGMLVVYHDLDSELAFLAQVVGLLDQIQLAVALHSQKTFPLLVIQACGSSHF